MAGGAAAAAFEGGILGEGRVVRFLRRRPLGTFLFLMGFPLIEGKPALGSRFLRALMRFLAVMFGVGAALGLVFLVMSWF